jgi:hypothetical protein
MLPSTLKYNVQLPNIRKITVEYRDQCKDIGPAFQFLRKYSADIKYHNPELVLERIRTEDGPIKLRLTVYTKNREEPTVIDTSSIKGTEGLWE